MARRRRATGRGAAGRAGGAQGGRAGSGQTARQASTGRGAK